MAPSSALVQHLQSVIQHGERRRLRDEVIPTILEAISDISKTLRVSQHVSLAGTANAFGDDQLNVDVASEKIMRAAIAKCPSIHTASSEEDPVEKPACTTRGGGGGTAAAAASAPVTHSHDANGSISTTTTTATTTSEECYTVAFDPLDGSSIIAPNWTVGTIVGVWDGRTAVGQSPAEKQVAAIMGVIGPRTTAIVALRLPGSSSSTTTTASASCCCFEVGLGVDGVSDCDITRPVVELAAAAASGASCASKTTRYFAPANLRLAADDERYSALIARFIREKYTLRYCGGLVPDVVHALVKGHGVYVSPVSPGTLGKLRFLYELYPIALIMECAGGKAIDPGDGGRILEKVPVDCDGRGGLVCGTKEEVDIVRDALLG